jgi:hypothetical protein
MASWIRFVLSFGCVAIVVCLSFVSSFSYRFRRLGRHKFCLSSKESPDDDGSGFQFIRGKDKLLRDAQRLREEAEKLECENNDDANRAVSPFIAPPSRQRIDSFTNVTIPTNNIAIENKSVLVMRDEELVMRLATLDKLAGTSAQNKQLESEKLVRRSTNVQNVYEDIQPWFLRASLRLIVSVLFLDVDRSIPIVKEDTDVLERAFVMELNETFVRVVDIVSDNNANEKVVTSTLNDLMELDTIRSRVYVRANELRSTMGLPLRAEEELLAIVATEISGSANGNNVSLSETSRWYQAILNGEAPSTSIVNAPDASGSKAPCTEAEDGSNSYSAVEVDINQSYDPNDPWSKLTTILESGEEIEEAKCSAERFISEYFTFSSRRLGFAVGRDGAGRFQSEVLKDVFEVSEVNFYQGAVIFDGRPRSMFGSNLGEELSKRLANTSMGSEVSFVVMMNERYPSLEDGIAQAAMETLLRTSQAVVVFPKSWNSTVDSTLSDPGRVFWRSLLSTSTALSSTIFAASSYHLFSSSNPNNVFSLGEVLPPDILPMAMVPLLIHYIASLTEVIAGRLRGFDVKPYILPTFTLFTFGTRSTFATRPQNRNDLFDVAAIGVSSALLSSFALLWIGLDITVHSSTEIVNSFPTVPLALVETNTVLSQWISSRFPGIFNNNLADAGLEIHLHWLAIAGACSLLAHTFQLLPLDNSAGAKMSYAVLGRENFSVLSLFAGVLKLLFLFPNMISLGNSISPIISKTRLLFDYVITSQIATSVQVSQCV